MITHVFFFSGERLSSRSTVKHDKLASSTICLVRVFEVQDLLLLFDTVADYCGHGIMMNCQWGVKCKNVLLSMVRSV